MWIFTERGIRRRIEAILNQSDRRYVVHSTEDQRQTVHRFGVDLPLKRMSVHIAFPWVMIGSSSSPLPSQQSSSTHRHPAINTCGERKTIFTIKVETENSLNSTSPGHMYGHTVCVCLPLIGFCSLMGRSPAFSQAKLLTACVAMAIDLLVLTPLVS